MEKYTKKQDKNIKKQQVRKNISEKKIKKSTDNKKTNDDNIAKQGSRRGTIVRVPETKPVVNQNAQAVNTGARRGTIKRVSSQAESDRVINSPVKSPDKKEIVKSDKKPVKETDKKTKTSRMSVKDPAVLRTAGGKNSKKKAGICPYASKCGGCNYQGIKYADQLEKKRMLVGKLLGKFGHVEPVIGMTGPGEEPKFYRNKVHHIIDRDRKNNVISGIYQEGSHKLVAVKECMLEDKKSQEIIDTICQLAKDFKIKIYDEDTEFGLLRHVLIRKGFKTGEIMVVIVIASRMFPSKSNFVKALIAKHPEISTVVFNINNRNDSMVLGERSETAYGRGFIEDELCGLKFRISPDSFYQINPVQTEKLYKTAIEYAGFEKGKNKTSELVIIDAYCGIGTIGLSAAAAYGKAKVIGVEINANAVKDARINAKVNEITNAEFFKGDAGAFMEKMAAEGKRADVVFMDPPRAGSDSRFIQSLLKLNPDKVVYVSCNPQTQERDLKKLTAGGYKAAKIQPVDMFPYTEHVETVVLLMRG